MGDLIGTIRQFIVDWGYWGVAAGLLLENAGIPVPGETILILASVVSYNTNELSLPWIIIIGTIAATAGDKSATGSAVRGDAHCSNAGNVLPCQRETYRQG